MENMITTTGITISENEAARSVKRNANIRQKRASQSTRMLTFQDFQEHETDRAKWLGQAIASYRHSSDYQTAVEANQYEKQLNPTINNYVKMVYDITGVASPDFTSTNNRIASNFFHRLNTQRCSYSLGNGVTFAGRVKERDKNMKTVIRDTTKDELGKDFDNILYKWAYYALIHGWSYLYDNDGEFYVFPMTEFMPFEDEVTGKIRAGVRFWSLGWNKRPIVVDLYEEDGYSRYMTPKGKYGLGALELAEKKRPYKEVVQYSEADGEEIIGGDNYASLPIIRLYGSKAKQSTLIGLQANIDAYDMVHSGFANDLAECAQVYWLINNTSGMNDDDIRLLRDRLLLQHMAVVDENNSNVTPYTTEPPFNAREACLNRIKASMYRDFGALDVDNISSAARTATEIEAAYQPMDEEADDFEYQIIQGIRQLLKLMGLDDMPIFKRNKISNQKEQTETVLLAANYLDDETVLNKLPFITVDEVDDIILRKDANDQSTFEPEE